MGPKFPIGLVKNKMSTTIVSFNVLLMATAISLSGAIVIVLGQAPTAPASQPEEPTTAPPATAAPATEEVTFTLYTPQSQTVLSATSLQAVNPNLTSTILLIHGWLLNYNMDQNMLNLTYAYRVLNNTNVIHVNWNRSEYYAEESEVYETVNSVGTQVGQMILALIRHGVNVKSVRLIGQALGAHISGQAGRFVSENLPDNATIHRITALDAAGPAFTSQMGGMWTNPNSLRSTDADIVDVTHTNDAHYGIAENIGTIDFFINGGRTQPTCGNPDRFDSEVGQELVHGCSHNIAVTLFQRTIGNNQYQASTNAEECEELVTYGDGFNGNATGVYYVRTQNEYPYRSLC